MELLLLLPGLSGIFGGPDFIADGDQLAMQSVREFDPDDIIREFFAIRQWAYPRPALTGIRRVVERARRSTQPNFLTICCQCAKLDTAGYWDSGPTLARIE